MANAFDLIQELLVLALHNVVNLASRLCDWEVSKTCCCSHLFESSHCIGSTLDDFVLAKSADVDFERLCVLCYMSVTISYLVWAWVY